MTHKVIFTESAWQDVDEFYDWIADRADAQTALAYLTRVHDFCLGLRHFPNRGTPRDDLALGMRTIAFERRVVVAYFVDRQTVQIVRILHHGRDVDRHLTP